MQTEIQKVSHILDNSASDEANLEIKIEKKKAELERNQKRLRSLANVRPAFMDEYDKLDGELSKQYEVYVEKHRNLSYLEHLLEEHNKVEQNQMEVSMYVYQTNCCEGGCSDSCVYVCVNNNALSLCL